MPLRENFTFKMNFLISLIIFWTFDRYFDNFSMTLETGITNLDRKSINSTIGVRHIFYIQEPNHYHPLSSFPHVFIGNPFYTKSWMPD